MVWGIPWSLTTSLRKSLVMWLASSTLRQSIKCASLLKRFTTTKMESKPFVFLEVLRQNPYLYLPKGLKQHAMGYIIHGALSYTWFANMKYIYYNAFGHPFSHGAKRKVLLKELGFYLPQCEPSIPFHVFLAQEIFFVKLGEYKLFFL